MQQNDELTLIYRDNDPQYVFDKHYALRCPHCGVQSNITAVSIPRYEYLARFRPQEVGITYRCDSCNAPVFLRFRVAKYETDNSKIWLSSEYKEVERPQETYEFQYLPKPVAEDFGEALTCYSNGCLNAFAAMCRRCVQSASAELGADGKDKVLNQLRDLKGMASIDNETFDTLKQITISGHDGAHPHLPKLSEKRAAVLLELMKDVLYQLFVRGAKIREAVESRKQDIESVSQQA